MDVVSEMKRVGKHHFINGLACDGTVEPRSLTAAVTQPGVCPD